MLPLINILGAGSGFVRRRFTWAVIVLSMVIAGSIMIQNGCSSFGGTMSGERLKRVQASPNYHGGEFVNTQPHPPLKVAEVWGYLVEQIFGDQIRVPPSAIPMSAIAPASIKSPPPPGLRAIWLGHSSVYIELDGFRLLVDPVFSDYASPFDGIGPKRFHPLPITMTDLPVIDAVIVSHDHYDHLDMRTVQYLSSRGTRFIVPLGVGAHLDEWEVPKDQITELDWWESTSLNGLTIICTPAQHYSSRGLFDYKETLWSSWSVIGSEHRFFYSGDTGFSDHFAQIGNRFGTFDLSIIKIGQYGPGESWVHSHMNPEEAVKAHIAVQARPMLPVSWGTFNIAFHDWDEPITRAVKAANAQNVDLVTPRVGDVVTVGEPFELTYVSNGEDQRVWLDLTCTSCDPNALEGKVTASNEAGKRIAKTKLEEPIGGYTYSHSEHYDTHTIEGHPFLDVPAQPAGEQVTIRGTLKPEPMQVYRLGPLTFNEGLPLPAVKAARRRNPWI